MFNNQLNASTSEFNDPKITDTEYMNYNEDEKEKAKYIIPYEQRRLSQITIKQIKTAPPPQHNETLKVDDTEVFQVVMIAQIESINAESSHTTYQINDYTGSLQAKKWNKHDEEKSYENDQNEVHLVKGKWVRIFGRINHYQGVCSIDIWSISPITDYNEIAYHFLECIYAHLENTVGYLNSEKQSSSNFNFKKNINDFNPNHNFNTKNDNNFITNNDDNGLSSIENKIIQIINASKYANNDAGCNVDVIFKQLPKEDLGNIREAIEKLENDGIIYSTVDEEHYKCSI